MKKFIAIQLIFVFACICPAQKQNPFQKPLPVRDGFVLDGIDGKITSTKDDQWFFTVYESLTDGKGVASPKTPMKIMPSSMLEKLIAAVSPEKNSYRIWGKLTTFQGKNFVYLTYFMPVTETNEPKQQAVESVDANETQIIPDDVLALLKPKRVISLAELKKPLGTEADGILADRTGFLRKTEDGLYFGFDAMGRNIDLLQLPLLPCDILEMMKNQQDASGMPLRFKISAIVTRYKGKNYLLLQRATRAYNCGNFAK